MIEVPAHGPHEGDHWTSDKCQPSFKLFTDWNGGNEAADLAYKEWMEHVAGGCSINNSNKNSNNDSNNIYPQKACILCFQAACPHQGDIETALSSFHITPKPDTSAWDALKARLRKDPSFPLKKVNMQMRRLQGVPKIDRSAVAYMAATLEYLAGEVLELAGNGATEDGLIRPDNILQALRDDEELKQCFIADTQHIDRNDEAGSGADQAGTSAAEAGTSAIEASTSTSEGGGQGFLAWIYRLFFRGEEKSEYPHEDSNCETPNEDDDDHDDDEDDEDDTPMTSDVDDEEATTQQIYTAFKDRIMSSDHNDSTATNIVLTSVQTSAGPKSCPMCSFANRPDAIRCAFCDWPNLF